LHAPQALGEVDLLKMVLKPFARPATTPVFCDLFSFSLKSPNFYLQAKSKDAKLEKEQVLLLLKDGVRGRYLKGPIKS